MFGIISGHGRRHNKDFGGYPLLISNAERIGTTLLKYIVKADGEEDMLSLVLERTSGACYYLIHYLYSSKIGPSPYRRGAGVIE